MMMHKLPPPQPPRRPDIWAVADWVLCALLAALILIFLLRATTARAQYVPPAPRIARSVPAEARAAAEARRKHNDSLRQMFRAVGVPDGSDPASVNARAAAIDAVVSAITNRAEIANGVTALDAARAVSALATNTPTKGPAQ